MSARLAASIVAALLGAQACSQGEARTSHAPPAVPAAPAAQPDETARLKGLALADSRGSSKLDETLLGYRRAAERHPERVDGWVLLGRAWVAKARTAADPGFYLHADACAQLALRISPKDRMALELRALVLLNDHRFEEARALAEELVREHPEDATAYGVLSDAALETGRDEAALHAAEGMLHVKPNLPSYGRASYLAWIFGDSKRAVEFARLAIDSGKDGRDLEPWAWQTTETAMLFWHQGDYEGALAGFEQVGAVVGPYAPALAGRGRALLSLGRAREAIAPLRDALEKAPLVDTAALLCDAHRAAGEPALADAACARAEALGEKSDPRGLSLYYSTRGLRGARAVELAQRDLAERPGIYSRDAVAWALYREGRIGEARAEIDRALAHGTRDARLVYHAGAIRIAGGEAKEGRAMVKDALRLNPGFDLHGAAEAKALLAAAEGGR